MRCSNGRDMTVRVHSGTLQSLSIIPQCQDKPPFAPAHRPTPHLVFCCDPHCRACLLEPTSPALPVPNNLATNTSRGMMQISVDARLLAAVLE